MKRLILTFVLGLSGIATNAATISICDCQAGANVACIAGDNSNPGTSAAAPKQNLSGLSLVGANTYQFCLGGSLTGLTNTFPPGGTSSTARTAFLSYSSPNFTATEKPILTFTSGGFSIVRESHVEIGGLKLIGANAVGEGFGVTLTNGSDVYVHDNEITMFDFGIHASEGDNSARTADFTIVNNDIHGNVEMGFEGAPDRLLLQGNHIHHNGTTSPLDHNVYIGAVAYRADSIIVRGNTLDNNTPNASGGKCRAVDLVVHGPITNLVIEDNTITELSADANCYGISVSHDTGGSVNAHNFKSLIVRGNRVVLGDAASVGITWNSATNAVIENNEVWIETSAGAALGIDWDGGMWTGDSPTGVERGDVYGSHSTVRNNTVYLGFTTAAPSGNIACIRAGSAGSIGANANDVVVGNICYLKNNSGDATALQAFNVNGRSISTFSAWDYNLAYCPDCTIKWADGAMSTLANAISAGFDTHSINADPVFVAVPASGNSYNMQIQTSSPAKNAGHPSLSSRTTYGRYMTNGQRDIGADEYGKSVAAPSGIGPGQRF